MIAQYFPPDMGGGATRASNVAKGLVLNSCKVTVITAFPHYPAGNVPERYKWKPFQLEMFDGLKVIRTFVPAVASQGLVKRLIVFLSFMISSLFAVPFVGKVDVVWAANPNVLSIFPAIFYGLLKRKPVALNVDDLWPEDLYAFGLIKENSLTLKIMRFVTRLAYVKAKLITPISPSYVKIICGKYGVDHEKVVAVRAGVDLNKFRALGNSFNCHKGIFRVLYSGAFSVAYDFDQVLLAAKALENVSGVEFVLQGGGELVGYVKSRADELGLKNLKVIDNIVKRGDVAKLTSEANALILPLRNFERPYLGISSKLYEYQAVDKPIICCAEGQPAEYVEETRSGIVVKPGDHEALAKSILCLRETQGVAEKLGTSGRRYVQNNLSIEKIGLEMRKLFEALM